MLEFTLVQGTPAERIHSIIAQADRLLLWGTSMMACAIQVTGPVVVLRAWISGLDVTQCIILTVICAVLQALTLPLTLPRTLVLWMSLFSLTCIYDSSLYFNNTSPNPDCLSSSGIMASTLLISSSIGPRLRNAGRNSSRLGSTGKR